MASSNDDMNRIERIAAEAWDRRNLDTSQKSVSTVISPADDKLGAKEIELDFVQDVGDTWSVHVGPAYLAIRNPEQGVVISRLVEMLAEQWRVVVFEEDRTERDHE